MFKKLTSIFIVFTLLFVSTLTAVTLPASAQELTVSQTGSLSDSYVTALQGRKNYNLSKNEYSWYFANPITSYLVENSDSSLTRIECIIKDSETKEKEILIETYSHDATELLSTKTMSLELPIFGGFYSGKEYNYLVFGNTNLEEDDNAEVVRIVKYSKLWERLGSTSVYGANTIIPFDAGSLRMTELNGVLYVFTSHEMYASEDGLNHQANMMFLVDQETDELIKSYHLVSGSYVYASHSFNQFIETDGNRIYTVDHGDAYPRSIVLGSSNPEYMRDYTRFDVIDLNKTGTLGENWTGATVGGFELTENNCIIAGNVVNYEDYDVNPDDTRNIYVAVTAKDFSSSAVKRLTNYTVDSEISVSNPHLVKISNTKLLVIWEEKDNVTYEKYTKMATVDENGNLTSEIYSNDFLLSDCKPILCKDGFVKWYAGTDYKENLYCVDPQNLSATANDNSQQYSNYPFETPRVIKSEIDENGITIQWKQVYNENDSSYSYLVLRKTNDDPVFYGMSYYRYNATSFTDTSAKVGNTYTYVILCVNSNGEYVSEFSGDGHIVNYLETPQITEFENYSNGTKITWNKIDGAQKYRLYIKTNSGFEKLVDTDSNSYFHTDLVENESYTYTVQCIRGKLDFEESLYNAEGFTNIFIPTDKTIYKLGDANGDGEVSITDATTIQRHIAGIEYIPQERIEAADVNNDGSIRILDATLIQRFVAMIDSQL
ncbi:MAG: dockerin type I repeat-containing protein [Ruminococcus sp.]|nr:dockerin type I repeat-containing protein [Ruminococcus sp.]